MSFLLPKQQRQKVQKIWRPTDRADNVDNVLRTSDDFGGVALQWYILDKHNTTMSQQQAVAVLLASRCITAAPWSKRVSGISWAICKSAPRSRQITMPAPHRSVFTGRMPFLPPNQQRQSTEGICDAMLVQYKLLVAGLIDVSSTHTQTR